MTVIMDSETIEQVIRVLENEIQVIIETGDQPEETLEALKKAVLALENAH